MFNDHDKRIINAIEERIAFNPDYWSFKDVTRKSGIHQIMRYPATMVPQMLEELIKILADDKSINNLLDPFMGSGTVLVEGIKNNLNVYGMDINPMSYLLCEVKTSYFGVQSLKKEFYKFKKDMEDGLPLTKKHEFKNINKWFKEDIIIELSKLRSRIEKVGNARVKKIMWICFADVITDVKNSQSSTFKLHIKKEEKIVNFSYNVISEFLKKFMNAIDLFENYYNELRKQGRRINRNLDVIRKIECGDNRSLLKTLNLEQGSIDLIVTSPPYGDNGTTVTYGQYSILPLYWMMSDEVLEKFDNGLFENFSAIDSSSLGGKRYTCEQINDSGIHKQSVTLKKYYEELMKLDVPLKARKVSSFMIDFRDSLEPQIDVLRKDGYMVMVVGNRTVHNVVFPFNKAIEEILEEKFCLITSFERNIYNKKIARKISKVGKGAVSSISKETILILRKK